MHAILVVQEHPFYAVTGPEGRFKLTGIPEGRHTLSVWHESLGEIKAEAGPDKKFLTLTFPGKDGKGTSKPKRP